MQTVNQFVHAPICEVILNQSCHVIWHVVGIKLLVPIFATCHQRNRLICSCVHILFVQHCLNIGTRKIALIYLLTNIFRLEQNSYFIMAFSNFWHKMLAFLSDYDLSLFPRDQLTIFKDWFKWWRDAEYEACHYLNQSRPSYLTTNCFNRSVTISLKKI